jgi:hypothetical protein
MGNFLNCIKQTSRYCLTMSLEQIKSEMAELSPAQQDHLAAYLVHLRHQHDAATRREITERIDNRDPKHWLTVDALREKWKD